MIVRFLCDRDCHARFISRRRNTRSKTRILCPSRQSTTGDCLERCVVDRLLLRQDALDGRLDIYRLANMHPLISEVKQLIIINSYR